MRHGWAFFMAIGFTLLAQNAHASRARLEALGESKDGSFYLIDERNSLLNPAWIPSGTRALIIETGSDPESVFTTPIPGTLTSSVLDDPSDPRAEAGLIGKLGSFDFRLQINHAPESVLRAIEAVNVIDGASVFLYPKNTLELQFARGDSFRWGLSVIGAHNYDPSSAYVPLSAIYWGARAGFDWNGFSLFGTFGVKENSFVRSNLQVAGVIDADLGLSVKAGAGSLFARAIRMEDDFINVSTRARNKRSVYEAGYGWKWPSKSWIGLYSRLSAAFLDERWGAVIQAQAYDVPFTISAEGKALSWLTLRASIAQALLGRDIAGRNGEIALARVHLGVGIELQDLTVDALVGTSGASAAGGLGMGTGAPSGGSFGFGNSILSRLAMSYKF